MIAALAFVPMADLSQQCVGNEQVILDYFETNYIGEFRRGRRRDPRFPHNLWNIHRRVVLVLPRTNKHVGGMAQNIQRIRIDCSSNYLDIYFISTTRCRPGFSKYELLDLSPEMHLEIKKEFIGALTFESKIWSIIIQPGQ